MLSRHKKLNRWLLIGGLITQLIAAAASATNSQHDAALRIHRYDEFNLETPAHKAQIAAASANPDQAQRRSVNFYGKQLVLSLETNARLNTAHTDATLLRGSVENKIGSWVRLAHTAKGTYGLIWDGSDMYAVEPSTEIRSALAVSLPAPTSTTVIFKLADASVDLGNSCGSADAMTATPTGMATYQALTEDMTRSEASSTTGDAPSLLLELQSITDAAFRAQYVSDDEARSALLVRLNNMDGIFSAQMGLSIVAADIQINATDPVGLSATTVAGDLLASLGAIRNSSPEMRTYAATHLFTGRDLDGDTLGIAYIGQLCGARFAASLSEVRTRGAWIDSLVAAHEIAHQLGAVHDGTGSCAGTAAQSFLMSPQVNSSSELSQCSRDAIFATMQTASCLVPAQLVIVTAGPEPAPAQSPPDSAASGGGAFDVTWLSLAAGLLAWRCYLRSMLRPAHARVRRVTPGCVVSGSDTAITMRTKCAKEVASIFSMTRAR